MARAKTTEQAPAARLLTPAELAQVRGEVPVRAAYWELWTAQVHQAYACRCEACGHLTRAAFPEGVKAPAQDGSRIASLAMYLQTGPCLPEDRLAELFRDLLHVRISAAILAGTVRQAAQRWRGPTERLCDWLVQDAAVKHLDETGSGLLGGRSGCPG